MVLKITEYVHTAWNLHLQSYPSAVDPPADTEYTESIQYNHQPEDCTGIYTRATYHSRTIWPFLPDLSLQENHARQIGQ
jgi:hypothetical protein